MKLRVLGKVFVCILGATSTLLFSHLSYSKEQNDLLDTSHQQEIVNQFQHALESNYVIEEQINKIKNSLTSWQANSKSKAISKEEFMESFNQSLQKFANDKHLRLEYAPSKDEIKIANSEHDFSSEDESFMWHSQNLGFKKVERLPFNIGLIKIDAFAPAKYAAPLVASSFNFIQNTDALILDLRNNFGGYEYTAPLLASYLLDKETHLFSMFDRKLNKLEERWSHKNIEGARYSTDKPVYILIDRNTFSAGETFAYTLKHLNRVTLVGETTAGASNAGTEFRINKDFVAFIPTKKMINPITKSNFEGKGVIPDELASSDSALNTAQKLYLISLLKKEKNDRRIERISNRLAQLEE